MDLVRLLEEADEVHEVEEGHEEEVVHEVDAELGVPKE